MGYLEIAEKLVNAVGGVDNITGVANCMTRVRFNLKDNEKVDNEEVKSISVVKGITQKGGQYQVVIGHEAVDICKAIEEAYALEVKEEEQEEEAKKKSFFDTVLDVMSGTMTPLIGIIVGTAMITALLTILTYFHIISAESQTYQFFSTAAGSCFYAFPIFAGFTAANKLKTDRYLGALIGFILIYPSLTNLISQEGGVRLFGIQVQAYSYANTVLPVILSVVLLKYVEKFVRKICPKVVAVFLVPMICLLILLPIIYLVIGPIGIVLTNWIGNAILWLSENVGFLAVGITAAILPLLVSAGMHMAVFSIFLGLIGTLGYDPIYCPTFLCLNIGVAGVALACGLRAPKGEEKSVGFSACVSGLMGISEPALYTYVFTNRRILISTMIALFISGSLAGILGLKDYVMGAKSVLTLITFLDEGNNLIYAIIVFIVSFVSCFLLTYFFGLGGKRKK